MMLEQKDLWPVSDMSGKICDGPFQFKVGESAFQLGTRGKNKEARRLVG